MTLPKHWPSAAGLAVGFMADRVFGDPRRGHPVAGFGAAASWLEARCYADRQTAGVVHTAALVGIAIGLGATLERLISDRSWATVMTTAAATWAVLGGRSLSREADHRCRTAGRREVDRCQGPGSSSGGSRYCRAVSRGSGESDRGVGRGERFRCDRRSAAVGGSRGTARAARISGRQHFGRHDRAPLAALSAVRLGGCPARRSGQLGAGATGRAGGSSLGAAGRRHRTERDRRRTPRRRATSQSERRRCRGGVCRRARRPARRTERVPRNGRRSRRPGQRPAGCSR